MQSMKTYIETLVRWAAPKAGGKRPANLKSMALPSKIALKDAQPSAIEQSSAAPPKRWWSKDGRVSKTPEELELTITEAVKATPGCEAFVGVMVQPITPKSRLDATWEIRAIRFGGMDRQIAREALAPIVERMQQEFRVTGR
jgi:hypothetical protein